MGDLGNAQCGVSLTVRLLLLLLLLLVQCRHAHLHIPPRRHTLILLGITLARTARQRLDNRIRIRSCKEWDRIPGWHYTRILSRRRDNAMHSALPAIVAPSRHQVPDIDEHCVLHRPHWPEDAWLMRVFYFQSANAVLE